MGGRSGSRSEGSPAGVVRGLIRRLEQGWAVGKQCWIAGQQPHFLRWDRREGSGPGAARRQERGAWGCSAAVPSRHIGMVQANGTEPGDQGPQAVLVPLQVNGTVQGGKAPYHLQGAEKEGWGGVPRLGVSRL